MPSAVLLMDDDRVLSVFEFLKLPDKPASDLKPELMPAPVLLFELLNEV